MATRVLVSGRVQGVGFRWSAAREAGRLGVSGTIRNLPDGRVEATLAGPDDAVAAMLTWLGHGPPGARVDGVERSESDDAADAGAPGLRVL